MGILDAFGKSKEKAKTVESNNLPTDNILPMVQSNSTEPSPINPIVLASEGLIEEEKQNEELQEKIDSIDEEVVSTNPVSISSGEISSALETLQRKPVDQKRAEMDFYKIYARGMDTTVNEIILKHGSDTNAILDELEARILQFQKDQRVFRVYEQHTRLRRSLVISERRAQDIEKRRKTDLNYIPMVDSEGQLTKIKKTVKKTVDRGKSAKDKLVADLMSKGLSEEQARKLIG